jgi:hypothetical protein
MLARAPLVPPPRRCFVHCRGPLFHVRPAASSPWVDAGQDRSFLYPISALTSLFTLRILPCPNRVHTHARVRDADAARGTVPLSRLRQPRLRPCRDCVAVLLAVTVVAEPPALTRANPVIALHSSSETEAPRSRPPRHSTSPHCRGRPSAWAHERQAKAVHVFIHTHARRRTPWCTTAELAAVAKPPTCLRAHVRTWTPPLSGQCSLTHARAKASPFCGQTSCELKPSPPTFSSSPGKPRS